MDANYERSQLQAGSTEIKQPRLLKVNEALAYLHGAMGRDTFYGKLATGEIPNLRAGNRYLISTQVLDALLEGRQ